MYQRIVIVLIGLSCSRLSHAVDLQPGEVVPPKQQVSILQSSVSYSERGDFYKNGEKVASNSEIKSVNYIVRIAQSFFINDMPAVVYAQTPAGYTHVKNSPTSPPLTNTNGDAGPGDTSLAFAIWPYADHVANKFFGMAAYLTLPSGSYSEQRLFNMGGNRYQYAFQTGYQQQILSNTHWMIAWDALYSSNNEEFLPFRLKLEQAPIYTTQTGLKYDLSARYSLAGMYFYTHGGQTTVNNSAMDDMLSLHRYQLSAQGNFDFGRLLLQYGGDIKTENKFKEDHRVILRYTFRF